MFKTKKMPEPKTKRCSKCGKEKPVGCFTKNSYNKDGLNDSCKECKHQFENSYKRNRRIHLCDIDPQNSRAGIDSWQQIDSVLREMAESQIAIDRENAALEKRLGLVKSYSDEIIEPIFSHQIALRAMLETFFKKELSKTKTTRRRFKFGNIFWHKGKIKIKLNTVLAENRMNKP
jgi:hypothetical protein